MNGCRTKMTGLDMHNMTLIENSLKKAFRNIDNDINTDNDLFIKSEVLEPNHFIKISVSLIWLMKV